MDNISQALEPLLYIHEALFSVYIEELEPGSDERIICTVVQTINLYSSDIEGLKKMHLATYLNMPNIEKIKLLRKMIRFFNGSYYNQKYNKLIFAMELERVINL